MQTLQIGNGNLHAEPGYNSIADTGKETSGGRGELIYMAHMFWLPGSVADKSSKERAQRTTYVGVDCPRTDLIRSHPSSIS